MREFKTLHKSTAIPSLHYEMSTRQRLERQGILLQQVTMNSPGATKMPDESPCNIEFPDVIVEEDCISGKSFILQHLCRKNKQTPHR